MVLGYLAIGFTIGLIVFKFTLSVIYFYLYFKKDKENRLVLAVGLFFLFMGISRIILLFFDFFLTGLNPAYLQTYSLVWTIGSIFVATGFGFFIIVADHNLFKGKDKYLLTIIYAVASTITLAIPIFIISETLSSVAIISAVLFIPISYLYVAIKSTGEIRRKALAVLFGLVVFATGLLLLGEPIIGPFAIMIPIDDILVRYTFHIISVCFKVAGGMIILYGYW